MTADSVWDDLDDGDFRRVPAGEKGAGSPLIIPVGGGEPVPYRRCTSFISAIEDDYGIAQWKRHLTVDGMVDNDDIFEMWCQAERWDDKVDICNRAFDAAGGWVKANNGTRMHAYTDAIDEEVTWPAKHGPPGEAEHLDLAAYAAAVRDHGLELVHAEAKVVHDDLKVAGTPDRVWRVDGVNYIGDLKTGKLDGRKCATQTALYSKSQLYDVQTGERTPLDVDQDRAIIIHLPYGEARARVLWVDIRAGWAGVETARRVHMWRTHTGLTKVMTPPAIDYVKAAAAASTVDELMALYERAVAADRWDFQTKTSFAIRRAQIEAAA